MDTMCGSDANRARCAPSAHLFPHTGGQVVLAAVLPALAVAPCPQVVRAPAGQDGRRGLRLRRRRGGRGATEQVRRVGGRAACVRYAVNGLGVRNFEASLPYRSPFYLPCQPATR